MSVQPMTAGGGVAESRSGTGLADVIDSILDKGLVIDAYASVSLVGIELLTINARVVVASVDTYLRFAEAVNRLDLSEQSGAGLPDLVGDMKKPAMAGKPEDDVRGALSAAADGLQGLPAEAKARQETPEGNG
jgi:hypothetical protein